MALIHRGVSVRLGSANMDQNSVVRNKTLRERCDGTIINNWDETELSLKPQS